MSDNSERRSGRSPIRLKSGETLADALANRNSQPNSMPMPLSDINDLDAVVHALGIEDSDTTPAEAVAELKVEIERLRALPAMQHGGPRSIRITVSFEDFSYENRNQHINGATST